MANYSKVVNFAAKDSMESGDPNKRVKGAEIDAELLAISNAIGTKVDTSTYNTNAASVSSSLASLNSANASNASSISTLNARVNSIGAARASLSISVPLNFVNGAAFTTVGVPGLLNTDRVFVSSRSAPIVCQPFVFSTNVLGINFILPSSFVGVPIGNLVFDILVMAV